MALNLPAAQFESGFAPSRLGNWQAGGDKAHGSAPTRFSTLAAPSSRGGSGKAFLAGADGHLLPGVRRINNAFRTRLGPADGAPTRWPKPSVTVRAAPSAVLGRKGKSAPAGPAAKAGYGPYDGVVTTRMRRASSNSTGKQ